jgi:two-component system NarL family sensor kinase
MTDTSAGSAASAPALRVLVWVVVAVVLTETAAALLLAFTGGAPPSSVLRGFAVVNLAICVAFGACGVVLAWFRPRHPVGWLLALSGCAQGATGLAGVALAVGIGQHWSDTPMLFFATLFSWGWPWSMGLGFFLALLLFPDGRLPGRRWRPVAIIIAAIGVLFVLRMGLDPSSSNFDGAHSLPHWGAVSAFDRAGRLWAVVDLLNAASLLAVLGSLVIRFHRGEDRTRRQLLWVVFAVLIVALMAVPVVLLRSGSTLLLLVFVLVPASILVAILRHNLLDIRLVVARTLAWALLTAILVTAYLLVVGVLGRSFAAGGNALVGAAVVAIGLNPMRLRTQRLVDGLLYGDRRDPLRVLRRVGPALTSAEDLASLADAIAQSLHLPYVSLRANGHELAAVGHAPAVLHGVPLPVGQDQEGELVVGVRRGDGKLAAADLDILELLAAPVAVAVHATVLAEELQKSRSRVVAARDDERRRLRRDLHDGLGPVLTGVGFKADAARNYVRSQPGEAIELLTELRAETAAALEDVRRLVYDLRPPILDDVGLLEALRRLAERSGRRADGQPLSITLDLPDNLPPLPAGVETATYRIAAEALTNVVRHTQASWATVRMTVDSSLHLKILNEQPALGQKWPAGVGLSSMHERAAELGGVLSAGSEAAGGTVSVTVPLDPIGSS